MDALKPPETVPIDHLLSNNDAPRDRRQFQRLLQELEEKQAALDALFNELSTRRAEYMSYAEGLSQVLAPCRMVPDDIWSMVFRFIPECCWEISWVCQRWRDVALSMPSLWAEIPEIGHVKQAPEGFISQFRTRSLRSGTQPLTVTTLRLPLALGLTPDDLEEFVTLFDEMVPRVRLMEVFVKGLQWTEAAFSFLTMISQRFDQLITANIHMYSDRPDSTFQETKLFQFSPKLTHLTLDIRPRSSATPITSWLTVPWANLVDLDIGWVCLQDLYVALGSSPNLERLMAYVDDHALGEVQDPSVLRQSIRHTRLRELVCAFPNGLDYLDTLSIVDLPKIKSMVFSTFDGEQWDYNSLGVSPEAFPTTPFAHLTHLYLGQSQARYYNSRIMADFLKLTPLIERLWLVWHDDMEQLFDRMSAMDEEGDFMLPSLKLLHITEIPADFFEETGCAEWHLAINRLARRRFFVDDISAGRGLPIALSSDRVQWTDDLELEARRGLQTCLNQAAGQFNEKPRVSSEDVNGVDPEDNYFARLRTLTEEIRSQSTAIDDLVRRISCILSTECLISSIGLCCRPPGEEIEIIGDCKRSCQSRRSDGEVCGAGSPNFGMFDLITAEKDINVALG